MQQIAKMFASLGFKVDTSGLDTFRKHLRDARADTALFARNALVLKDRINDVNKSLARINQNLKLRKTDNRISEGYDKLKASVERTDKAFVSIAKNQAVTTRALGKIHASIMFGSPLWDKYANSVQRTKDLLKGANAEMKHLRTNSTVNAKVNIKQSNSRTPDPFGTRVVNKPSTKKSNSFIDGLRDFGSSMLPATLLGGGLGALGYVGKEVVKRGREQQQMERSLQFATKDINDFKDSLKYVRSEAMRLGLSSATLGKTFGTVAGATEGKMSRDDLKKMFTNMNEYYTSVHASDYEKGLMNLAVQQMFSIGKIQGQEIGQLTGTGLITRAQLNKAIMETYNLKDTSKIESLQKAGKLDPSKVLDTLFKNLATRAHKTGAFDQAMESSVTKQGQMSEKFNQLSSRIMEGGLDSALSKLFDGINGLIDVFSDFGDKLGNVTNALKKVKESTTENKNEYLILGGTLATFLLPLFGKKLGALTKLKNYTNVYNKASSSLANVLTTRLGKALVSLAKRFTLVGTAIYALFKLGDSLTGKTTWIDVLVSDIELLGAKFEWVITSMKWKIYEFFTDNAVGRFLGVATNLVTGKYTTTPLLNSITGDNKNVQGITQRLSRESQDSLNRYNSDWHLPETIGNIGNLIMKGIRGNDYKTPKSEVKIIVEHVDQNGRVFKTEDRGTLENPTNYAIYANRPVSP